VVGEALANGMIIVASDEVGSAENLPSSVCQQFKAGYANKFLEAIESAVASVRRSGGTLRPLARSVAAEQFNPEKMAALLLEQSAQLLNRKLTSNGKDVR
jgi:hypothetical protein